MCDAKVEEVEIPLVDNPSLSKTVYKVTCREFKVGARKTYDYYTDKDLAHYIANSINRKDLLDSE